MQVSRPVLIVKREPRGPYQQVLVPVDFSEPSRRAAEMALRIAPQAGITLLHVFEVPFEGRMHYAGVDDETILSCHAEAREQANRAMQQFVSAKEYAGRLTVAKLNVDENTQIPQKYGIRGIPTLMLFKNGNIEATKVGALSKSQLTVFIDSHI